MGNLAKNHGEHGTAQKPCSSKVEAINKTKKYMPNALDALKKEDVNLEPSPEPQEPLKVTEEPKQEPATPASPETPEKPPKGFVPLAALHEERQKRQNAERELETLKSSVLPEQTDDTFSDEGKVLKGKIDSLESEVTVLKTELTKKDLIAKYPILSEKWDELEEFRANPENKGMNLRTAVKAFLAENGLFEPRRLGLEVPTGGPKKLISPELSANDIDDIRKNDFKRYREMVKKGQIKLK